MNRLTGLIILFVLFLALIATPIALLPSGNAYAQIFDEDYTTNKNDFVVETGIALRSDRVYRGQNLYNGASVQPELKVGHTSSLGTFHLGAFVHVGAEQGDPKSGVGGSFAVSDPDAEEGDDSTTNVARVDENFNEWTVDAGYERDIGIVTVGAGHRWINYSETNTRLRDTREVYGELTCNTVLNPYAMAAYEYDARTGWYYEAGVSQPIPLATERAIAIIPSITVGFNSGLNDGDHPIYQDSGFTHFDVGLEGDIALSDSLSLRPEVHYNEAEDDAGSSELWFGMNLTGKLNFQ